MTGRPTRPHQVHRFRTGADTFYLTYLRGELARRARQALLVTLGLAIGVGLVVTVTAAAAGVSDAQGAVLHSLYGIGTDVTITMAPAPAPSFNNNNGGAFTPGAQALSVDWLRPVPGLGVLDASSVAQVSDVVGVAAAAGGLTLTDTKLVVPSQSQLGPNGEPPKGLSPTSFNVDGVDLSHLGLGPIASTTVSSGRALTAADSNSNLALIDSGYAAANRLTVGSTITIAGADFVVAGIVRQPQGGGAADVYIPLERAQALAQQQYKGSTTFAGKVNTIYVAAANAADIPAVRAGISRLLPAATVTSSDSLASAVSGSLASAARLANDLGKWLSIAVLAAAFGISGLLTMGAVSRRVRELGTLKALGWGGGRIVAQIMGESLVVGLLGAALGVALGYGGAALVTALAPTLSATVASNPGSPDTIDVHLVAPVTATTVLLAIVLALAGSLIAGSFGAWRAVRLRPAAAVARVT
jgi:putative ABC transport system permease protein